MKASASGLRTASVSTSTDTGTRSSYSAEGVASMTATLPMAYDADVTQGTWKVGQQT